jgi:hypothetical protein
MARALGMNPKKLPRLRPASRAHWKLPVGAFIEECYWKRFGGAGKNQPRQSESPSRAVQALEQMVVPPQHVRDSASQVSSLVCYLTNLAEDLQRWLAHGAIDPEVLSRCVMSWRISQERSVQVRRSMRFPKFQCRPSGSGSAAGRAGEKSRGSSTMMRFHFDPRCRVRFMEPRHNPAEMLQCGSRIVTHRATAPKPADEGQPVIWDGVVGERRI